MARCLLSVVWPVRRPTKIRRSRLANLRANRVRCLSHWADHLLTNQSIYVDVSIDYRTHPRINNNGRRTRQATSEWNVSPLVGGIVEVGRETFATLSSSRAVHPHIVFILLPHAQPWLLQCTTDFTQTVKADEVDTCRFVWLLVASLPSQTNRQVSTHLSTAALDSNYMQATEINNSSFFAFFTSHKCSMVMPGFPLSCSK